MKFRNRRGQLSIINIIFFLIIIAISVVVTPIMNDFLTAMVVANNFTGISLLIVNAIIPMYWLGIVVTFFMYVTPIRPQQY